jgi:glycyl-tRNA synthetase
MALQGVRDFQDIRWNATFSYGDVYLQNEQECSKYSFELADVDHLRQMFDLFEAEAKTCLEEGLVLPAHDYVLKCSHTFNVLDTRGAIGVTERQAYFRRMRNLSRRVAEAYVVQRRKLEFPWLGKTQAPPSEPEEKPSPKLSALDSPGLFLLEIGTEELPSTDVDAALSQLSKQVPVVLNDLRLEHGRVQVLGTPRRLVVFVEHLAPCQRELEQVVRGPSAERAFAPDGTPTKAAEGFARSKNVSVQDLEVREMNGGQYLVALVRQAGRPTAEVLVEALPKLIAGLSFSKTMRWNDTNVPFSRPVRWLLALHGEQVIPFQYAGLQAGNCTRGLRFSNPAEIQVSSPAEYFTIIEAQGIVLDPDERQRQIEQQVHALAAEVGGGISADDRLLREVTHLVEAPQALRGDFNPRYLELPREVLIAVMKKHQRYFPVERQGELLPHFITVANKPWVGSKSSEHYALIVRGNEEVVRARFTDAAYFVRQDEKKKLEEYLPKLKRLTFQEDLGSMWDKTQRIENLVGLLAPMLSLSPDVVAVARRAAHLCKADLATQMVVDMTSLQGVMGRIYALHSGESEAVATAIYEHYLPRFAGDAAPQTEAGLLVGIADRLDTLTGLFAAGIEPTGAKDPFAQRRAALGLVSNLLSWELDFDLRKGIEAAASLLPIPAASDSQASCLNFIIERFKNLLLDRGYRYDVVDAVLAAQGHNPARAAEATGELEQWVKRDDWHTILPAFARCVRLVRQSAGKDQKFTVDPQAFVEPAEEALFADLQQAEASQRVPGSVNDFLQVFVPLVPTINQFFDQVLVMTEEEHLRRNRLGLLQRIAALADKVADLSYLEGF